MSDSFIYDEIAKLFDHSLLQPQLTDADMQRGCELAARYGVMSVCIKPYAVALAANILAGSGVRVGTVIGFPHGSNTPAIKLAESERAMDDGAVELDMVVNIGKVLGKDWDYVAADIAEVVAVAHGRHALVKVIFENSLLKNEHKEALCRICSEVGADFVKTSTGYGETGATEDDLILMRKHTAPQVGVKAAGGVRNLDRVLAMRKIGVTRIGATVTAEILEETKRRLGMV